ncbi:putative ribonuclease H-like domain-containing protein [Tanacetum coccineum]
MAYSSTSSNSKVSTDSNCSSSCLENVKILKEQNEQLLKDLRTSKINAITYKTGLESVEARLLIYKKNGFVYEEDIKLLKQEFVNEPIVNEPTVKKPVVETSEAKASADKPKVVKKNNGAPIIEDWVSDSEEEDMPQAKIQKKTVKPSFAKIEFVKSKDQVKTPRKTTVKQGNQNRLNTHIPRGNQRNWNNMMSQRLESNFEMINQACYNCDNHQRQFNNKKMVKPVWNYTQRVNYQNFSRMTHPSPKRNMVPKAVLMRSGLVSLTTARPVNTAQPITIVNCARPMTNVFNKSHSTVRMPINNKTTTKNSNFNQRVNTVSGKNVNTGNPQMDLQDQGVIDSGCSRHMTRNMSYLTDFEEIDGGYVAFGGNPKGGKITGRCIIQTGNLDFENVYFLTDESHVLLKVPRKNNMYSVDLKNIVPKRGLTCLFVKATSNESKLWHRRIGHINFKTMNKLVKGNLVRGLPSKLFENDQTCVACQKGKQHRASYDYSRFSWVFFLVTKDETSGILKSFITGVENLIDQRVKVIRCNNETEFKNKEMNQFCKRKGIKREFSVARTPQQNGVAERKNKTLIEAARTMLADSKLPTTFWAKAVNTACYVQNRVLVIKPHNKTPYELFLGRKPALGFMRPFGCPVTILNTIDHLGKFDGKADEGFFVGYSINSKAFRVFNSRTRIVEENLHVQFSENTPNIAGSGPNWLFDIDALTKSMNYKPVIAGNQSNGNADTKACDNAGKARMETVPDKDYIMLPLWPTGLPFSQNLKSSPDAGFKPSGDNEKKDTEELGKEGGNSSNDQEKEDDNINNTNNVNTVYNGNSTNNVNAVSLTVNAAGIEVNVVGAKTSIELPDDPNMPELEYIVYSDDAEDVGAEADMNNLNKFILVSPIPTTRIHKDHPVEQTIGDLNSTPQTRRMTKNLKEHEEPKKTLVDLPNGKRAIGTKWVFKNKKDERGIVIKNKQRLVAQGYTQEEGIDYDEVFAPIARIEAIRLFLAYASFKDFVVYQIDVNSAFIYGKIEEEVYVCQPSGFEDLDFPDRVYKVEKALYGLHQAPRAWYETLSTYLLNNGFQRGKIDKILFIRKDKGLQVKQKEDEIFISQDKYITEILKKFGFTNVKTASTPIEIQKPLLKDEDGEEVDVHLYRSMIGSLMYLTSSRPDIMFAVCACARYQVNPKVSHLHAVKRIFRYLKGQPKLGLWYPKDSPFDLVAYTDSDYAGASLDRKSTTGVAFLTKSAKSEGFKQIVDFLNASSIKQGEKRISGRVTSLFPTMVVQAQKDQGEGSDMPTITQPSSSQPQKKHKLRKPKKKDIQIPQSNVPSDNLADEAVNEENVSKHFNDLLLSGEDKLKLQELMTLCTNLQNRVLDLEHTKTTQALEIDSLKRRVKKLEKKQRSRTHELRILYKGRKIHDIDADEDIPLENVHDIDADEDITLENVHDEDMFGVNDLEGDEIVVESEVAMNNHFM